jgi:prevent-host-death family protein
MWSGGSPAASQSAPKTWKRGVIPPSGVDYVDLVLLVRRVIAGLVVNIHEAKTHFSRLLERVARGEEIVIGKAGRPVAKLVPYRDDTRPRTPGVWQGQVHIDEDFDELPPEIAAAFRGELA